MRSEIHFGARSTRKHGQMAVIPAIPQTLSDPGKGTSNVIPEHDFDSSSQLQQQQPAAAAAARPT